MILIVWNVVEVMSVVDVAIGLLSEVVFEPAATVVDVFLEVETVPVVVLLLRDVAAPEADEALTVVRGGAVGPGK